MFVRESNSLHRTSPINTGSAEKEEPAVEHSYSEKNSSLQSLFQRITEKLIAIGMLDKWGNLKCEQLAALVPLRPLDHAQTLSFIDLLQNQHVCVIDKDGSTHYFAAQQSFLVNHVKYLQCQTFLTGDMAASIVNTTGYFCEMVRKFLQITGLPEDYLDVELAQLASLKQAAPKAIEWQSTGNNFDFQKLHESHINWLSNASYFRPLEHEATKESCFVDIHSGPTFFQFILGDKKGESASTMTKVRVGSERPLFSFDYIKIPVNALLEYLQGMHELPLISPICENFHQAVIHKTLKLLRLTGRIKRPFSFARTCLLLSQNYALAPRPIAKKWHGDYELKEILPELDLVRKVYGGDAAALAYMAAPAIPDAAQIWQFFNASIPTKTSLPIFCAELLQVIAVNQVPWQAVSSLLCFACWVKVCYPSPEWDRFNEFSITIEPPSGHFILQVQNCAFHIPVLPETSESILADLEIEKQHCLQNLWDLLVPTRITQVFSKDALIHAFPNHTIFAAFAKAANQLIANSSQFLNTIGYTCALAMQQPKARGGLDYVFKKLPFLLPKELGEMQQELTFLSSVLNEDAIFYALPKQTWTETLGQFVLHLLTHQQRYYGTKIMECLFLAQELALVAAILEELKLKSPEEAKRIMASLTEFLFKPMARAEQTRLRAIKITENIESSEKIQNLLLEFLQLAVDMQFEEQARQFLESVAKTPIFDNRSWELAAHNFCNFLLKDKGNGFANAYRAWNSLSALRYFLKPAGLDRVQHALSSKSFSAKPGAIGRWVVSSNFSTPPPLSQPRPSHVTILSKPKPVPSTLSPHAKPFYKNGGNRLAVPAINQHLPPPPSTFLPIRRSLPNIIDSPLQTKKDAASPSPIPPIAISAKAFPPAHSKTSAHSNAAQKHKPLPIKVNEPESSAAKQLEPSISTASPNSAVIRVDEKATETIVDAGKAEPAAAKEKVHGRSKTARSKRKKKVKKSSQKTAEIANGSFSRREQISVSESSLDSASAIEQAKYILNGWCRGIAAEKLKRVLTDAFLHIIANESTHLLELFAQHHLTKENCHLDEVFAAMHAFYETALPFGNEIKQFQLLLTLLQTPTLAEAPESFLSSLSQKIEQKEVPSLPDTDALLLLRTFFRFCCASNNAGLASRAIDLLKATWNQSSAFQREISVLLKEHEGSLLSTLVDRGFYDQACELLRYSETHNVRKINESVPVNKLEAVFKAKCAQSMDASELKNVFARLIFAVKNRLTTEASCTALLRMLPLLASDEQKYYACLTLLELQLNALEVHEQKKYYPAVIDAFGSKGEKAFYFLCRLKNRDNTAIFKAAAVTIFPTLDASTRVRALGKHPSFFEKPQPELLEQFSQELLSCAEQNVELSKIFALLETIKCWPLEFLKRLPSIRPNDLVNIYNLLRSNEEKEAFAIVKEEMELCYRNLFEAIFQNPKQLLLFIEISDFGAKFPQDPAFKERCIAAALRLITNPKGQIQSLKHLMLLRLGMGEAPLAVDPSIMAQLLASEDDILKSNAICLGAFRLQVIEDEEDLNTFYPIVGELIANIPAIVEAAFLIEFFNAIRRVYHDRFDEQIKAHILSEIQAKLPPSEKIDLEEELLTVFTRLFKNPDVQGLLHQRFDYLVCGYFLTHFCRNFRPQTMLQLQMLLQLANLRLARLSSDPGVTAEALANFFDFLKLSDNSDELIEEWDRHERLSLLVKNHRDLFDSSIELVCANMAAIVDDREGYEQKLELLVARLRALVGKDGDFSDDHLNGCYITLAECLLKRSLNEATFDAIESCFSKFVLGELGSNAPRFNTALEQFCSSIFLLDTASHMPLYLKMMLLIDGLKNNKKLPEELDHLPIIFHSIINRYVSSISKVDQKIPDAFLKTLEGILKNRDKKSMYAACGFLKILQPMLQVKYIGQLLNGYKLFYSRLSSVSESEALDFIKSFFARFAINTIELSTEPNPLSRTVKPHPHAKFYDLLFVVFFKNCLPDVFEQFPKQREALAELAVGFIQKLAQQKYFRDPNLLSTALSILAKANKQILIEKIKLSQGGTDFLFPLFSRFHEKPYLFDSGLLLAMFTFINEYLLDILNLHPKMNEFGSDVLADVMNSLGQLLEKRAFNRSPTLPLLYIKLHATIMPCCVHLMHRQLIQEQTSGQSMDIPDFISVGLFSEEIHRNSAFTNAQLLEEKIRLTTAYVQELLKLPFHKTLFHTKELMSGLKALLNTLLTKGAFDDGFLPYLQLVELLVGCNAALIKRELLEGKPSVSNYVEPLLFGDRTCRPAFQSSLLILKKISIANAFAKELIALDLDIAVSIGEGLLLQTTQLLMERVKKETFKNKASIYDDCVSTFVAPSIALARHQLARQQTPKVRKNIFTLLFSPHFPSSYLVPNLIPKKMKIANQFAQQMLETGFDEAFHIGKMLIQKHASFLIEYFDDKTSEDANFAYFACVKTFIPCCTALVKGSMQRGESTMENPIFTLLFSSLPKKTSQLEAELLHRKLAIAIKYSTALIETKEQKVIELGVTLSIQIREKMVSMLSSLQIRKASFAEYGFYFLTVDNLIANNLALVRVQTTLEQKLTDFISPMLAGTAFCKPPFLQDRISIISVFAKSLIELGHPDAIKMGISLLESHATLLRQHLEMDSSEQIPALYLACVKALMPVNAASIKAEFNSRQEAVTYITALLTDSKACTPAFQTIEMLKEKLTITDLFTLELIKLDTNTVSDLWTTSARWLLESVESQLFHASPMEFLRCVQTLFPSGVSLLLLEKERLKIKDILNQLLFAEQLKEKEFSEPQFQHDLFLERLKLAKAFSKLKDINVCSDFLQRSSEALLNGSSEFALQSCLPKYLDAIGSLMPVNLSLMRLQASQDLPLTDFASSMLIGKTLNSVPFQTQLLLQERLASRAAFAERLVLMPFPKSVAHGRNILEKSFELLDSLLKRGAFKDFALYTSCVSKLIPAQAALLGVLLKNEEVQSDYVSELLFGPTCSQSQFMTINHVAAKEKIAQELANKVADLHTKKAMAYAARIQNKAKEMQAAMIKSKRTNRHK